jgi:hypothetical protein
MRSGDENADWCREILTEASDLLSGTPVALMFSCTSTAVMTV